MMEIKQRIMSFSFAMKAEEVHAGLYRMHWKNPMD
jgi:hypothetical protein